jgi:hypothetical protein
MTKGGCDGTVKVSHEERSLDSLRTARFGMTRKKRNGGKNGRRSLRGTEGEMKRNGGTLARLLLRGAHSSQRARRVRHPGIFGRGVRAAVCPGKLVNSVSQTRCFKKAAAEIGIRREIPRPRNDKGKTPTSQVQMAGWSPPLRAKKDGATLRIDSGAKLKGSQPLGMNQT